MPAAIPPLIITVLDQALQALPASYRPDPKDPDAAQVLIRPDSAGATYGFGAAAPENLSTSTERGY
jgi:hypothetical protein